MSALPAGTYVTEFSVRDYWDRQDRNIGSITVMTKPAHTELLNSFLF